MDGIKKIVLTGPESSGKSFLAKELAQHFKTSWVREYARFFLEENGSDYDYPLLLKMAKAHKKYQLKYLKSSPGIIFLDTDLINYKIWCDVVYTQTHKWILDNIEKENDHRYLIAYPDLKWEPDPLRENPKDRINLFDRHLREIASLRRPYRVVKGIGAKRLKNAIILTKELLTVS